MTVEQIREQLDKWIENCEQFPLEKKGKAQYLNEGELTCLYMIKGWIDIQCEKEELN